MSNEIPQDEQLSEEQLDTVAGGVVMNFDDNLGGGASNPVVGTTAPTPTSTVSGRSATSRLTSLRQSVATSAATSTARTTTTPAPATNNITIVSTRTPPNPTVR